MAGSVTTGSTTTGFTIVGFTPVDFVTDGIGVDSLSGPGLQMAMNRTMAIITKIDFFVFSLTLSCILV
jgi:hypothetical protein